MTYIIIGSIVVTIVIIACYIYFTKIRSTDGSIKEPLTTDHIPDVTSDKKEPLTTDHIPDVTSDKKEPDISITPQSATSSPQTPQSEPFEKQLMGALLSIDHVKDNLYLSNWNGGTNYDDLGSLDIKHVICANETDKPQYMLNKYKAADIKHHHIEMENNYGYSITKPVLQMTKIMSNIPSSDNVLFFCRDGKSLSPFLLSVFISNQYEMPLREAYTLVKKKRSVVDILDNFKSQLINNKKELLLNPSKQV